MCKVVSRLFTWLRNQLDMSSRSKGSKWYYAVRRGRETGIFNTWEECKAQVDNYPKPRFKKFSSIAEAEEFVQGQDNWSRGGGIGVVRRHTGHHIRTHPYKSHTPTSSGDSAIPKVYSDGCCYGNGKKHSRAGVGVYWGEGHTHNVSESLTGLQTNQRAELVSAALAVEGAISQGLRQVEVCTDSSYTLKAVTEWIPNWQRNGWKTTNGTDVKNREDIERLHAACSKIDVEWTHVRGHKGIPGNEAADALAKAGANKR